MKKRIILFILSFFSISLFSTNQLDSLLRELDKVVNSRSIYAHRKETTIGNLKAQLSQTAIDEQRFNIYGKLFDAYRNYQTDSAYHIAKERIKLADQINLPKEKALSYMNLAEVMRTTGMYKESLDILESLRVKGLEKENRPYYYHLYHSLYILMADYSISEEDRIMYNDLVYSYKDTILHVEQIDTINTLLVESSKEIMRGEYSKALAIVNKAHMDLADSSAMVTYTLSEIYRNKGNAYEQKKNLALSAIADLKLGVKEYISLRELAILLYNDGDIDRAYSYMKCAMEDAIFCNARLRMLEVSKMLPLINETYDFRMQQERNRLFWLLFITIGLAIVLVITITYIYKQVKTLSSIRKYQKKMNTNLKIMNTKLNDVNSQLSDANLVKERYIGYVFNICSSYIDKLENFRLTVHKKVRAGQIEDLRKITSSSSLVDDELKEFYKNFDSIFLNLYPTFVQEFNALLAPDEQISTKDGELLTPELRIFALVRLGINDSVKIAEFLHYSPQTIYNYRLKVRNKTIVPKEDFAKRLSEIGLVDVK